MHKLGADSVYILVLGQEIDVAGHVAHFEMFDIRAKSPPRLFRPQVHERLLNRSGIERNIGLSRTALLLARDGLEELYTIRNTSSMKRSAFVFETSTYAVMIFNSSRLRAAHAANCGASWAPTLRW